MLGCDTHFSEGKCETAYRIQRKSAQTDLAGDWRCSVCPFGLLFVYEALKSIQGRQIYISHKYFWIRAHTLGYDFSPGRNHILLLFLSFIELDNFNKSWKKNMHRNFKIAVQLSEDPFLANNNFS